MKTPRLVPAALLTLLLAIAITAFGAGAAPPSGPPGLARAIAAQEAHTDALLARAGVVGTAVGLDASGQPVVKIYTTSRGVANLPGDLDGVPTEVEVTGELKAQADLVPVRPAPLGSSTGTERLMIYRGRLYCTVGTIGARLTNSSATFALSNAHVYALQGSNPSGAVQTGTTNGDRILQPGRADMTGCGSSGQINTAVFGRLVAYKPITISRTASNTVDAAIAYIANGVEALDNRTPADGYGTPTSTPATAALGMVAQKYGRTTGYTQGSVTGLNASVIISYDTGQARFVGQIVVTGNNKKAFSAGGDSGSLIVNGSNEPIALLFAGGSTTTIGNPIALVLQAFQNAGYGTLTIDGN